MMQKYTGHNYKCDLKPGFTGFTDQILPCDVIDYLADPKININIFLDFFIYIESFFICEVITTDV